MAEKAQRTRQTNETARKREPTRPVARKPVALVQQADLGTLQRAVANPRVARPSDILALQRTAGNQAVTRLIQTKLAVGPAGDRYEQEADRVAEQVMTMPAPRNAPSSVQRAAEEEEEVQTKPLAASITPLVQRQAAPEEEEVQTKPLVQRQEMPEEEEVQTKPLVQRQEMPEEEEVQAKPLVQRQEMPEEEEVQTKPLVQRRGDGSFEASPEFESRLVAHNGGGSPLSEDVRAYMEPRFGADFSGVRVHTGGEAAQLNREASAQAFTHGQDIYMSDGKYNPGSDAGKQLLAHELTHVVQQGGMQRHVQQKDLTTNASRNVQRHPVGKELPDKNAQVTEIGEKEKKAPDKMGKNATLAPEATRTKQVEMAEKKAGKGAGTAFTKSQKLTPGAMSLASAEKILQGAYGGLKKIVPGTIVILADQPACSAKYDQVCMADNVPRPDGSAWQAGDCAKDDAAAGVLTEGFAWKGVVYVNGATTLVTATAHEILHNNAEPNFRAKVGETFNEGVTETLARKALSEVGVKVPGVTAYPEQVKLTKLLIDLVGIDVVEKAYFENVQELVRMYNRKGRSTWSKLVQAAEALDTDKVTNALKRGFGT